MARRRIRTKTRDGDAALLEVVGTLYESVMEPDVLPDALRGVADLTGAHLAVRGISGMKGQNMSAVVSRGSHPVASEVLSNSSNVNAWDNPWTQAALQRPFGKVLVTEEFVPFAKLQYTPFYRQVLRPMDAAYGMGCNWLAGRVVFLSTVFRSEGQGPFSLTNIAEYQRLAPHLERSGLLALQLSQAWAAQQTLLEALHRLRLGLLIVDEHARVRFVNHSAERVLASNAAPLQARCGQLTASTADQTHRLRELISHAARAGAGLGVRPGGTLLTTTTTVQERPLEVVVSPLPIGAPLLAAAEPVALVTFRIDAYPGPSLPALLQQLYDLTPAEARVAQAILEGHGLGSAAEALGVQLNTARTHLYHVFDKTSTHRQAELVRLLAGFAALLADEDADDG